MTDFYSFASTSIGESHIKSNKPCQDTSASYADDDVVIIVVSDGHGSQNFTRSDSGSRMACECAIDATKEFILQIQKDDFLIEKNRNVVINQLCKNILLRWNNAVYQHWQMNPFSAEEVEQVSDKYKTAYLLGDKIEHAYGCTLLIGIITKDFFIGIRNGDGQCVTINKDAVFDTPIPWNENCNLNVTTSLCDNYAIEDFRCFYTEELPVAVFLGSDGIDNSYGTLDELYNLYRALCVDAINSGIEVMKQNIDSFLPNLTKRGSSDDVSIAGAINIIGLNGISTLILTEHEARKQLLEEQRVQHLAAVKEKEETQKKRALKKAEEQKKELEKKLLKLQTEHKIMESKSQLFKSNAESLSADIQQIEKKIQELNNQVTTACVDPLSDCVANEIKEEIVDVTSPVDDIENPVDITNDGIVDA